MLWTILIVLLVLWALGFGFGGAAVGSLIHLLLVLAQEGGRSNGH
ncbi:MAG: lmo0937 family membrane protein [Pyrinomonadaceae bacterium]